MDIEEFVRRGQRAQVAADAVINAHAHGRPLGRAEVLELARETVWEIAIVKTSDDPARDILAVSAALDLIAHRLKARTPLEQVGIIAAERLAP